MEIDQTSAGKAGKVSVVSECWLREAQTFLKESSVIKYENMLRSYILPVFGEMELSDITNENLVSFVGDLRTNGGIKKNGLAPSTVSEVVTTLNSLRIYALRHDYTIKFTPACVAVKQKKSSIRVFSRSEEKRLMAYLHEHMDLTSLGIIICLYTGIRIGELCALRWDAIDLFERTMQINKTVQRLRIRDNPVKKTEVRILEPKTQNSIRTIPLPDVLVELLERYQTKGAFLLTGDKTRFFEPRVIQKRFKRILEKSGIADANFHTTRHTFATRSVELGFDIKSLSEILGHSSVTVTMNLYVHPTMELKAENMNRFTKIFEE
ncbi:MAG: site-specific integrase [Eubacterium sp.]|nr:site-specific integrase [Eubacterium sp.]